MANKINFQVGYTVDRTGLTEIQNDITKLQTSLNNLDASNLSIDIETMKQSLTDLNTALSSSWNGKLGQLDLTSLSTQINQTFGSTEKFKESMESLGVEGANAYNKINSAILNTNIRIKESNKLLNSMATTLANTVRWNVASTAVNALTGAVQSAWSYTQKLDSSLNDIRIVTGKSAEDMESFAQSANNAAKALGASTTAYTNASLIYYQQGLSDEEVEARTEVTLKTANVTGQSTSEVSEQLTAVWNGYNVATENAEESIDILAAVAASTASDLEELSTGMSKVASAASALGVGEEQLAAQLSTIISVTRQAPESVGTALKTIYARMSDIEAGLDDETTLGSYTGEMAELGINVLDATGNLRDMGEVIEEIGEKWADFSREQQISLAQTMAGTRQYNNLIALFDNWDDYTAALDVANNATGTLQKQQDIYMESVEAHLQQLSTAMEGVYDSLADSGAINTIIDGLTQAVEVLNDFVDGANSGFGILQNMALIGANLFSNQIGSSLGSFITNRRTQQQNSLDASTIREQIATGYSKEGEKLTDDDGNLTYLGQAYESEAARAEELLNLQKFMTQEEYSRLKNAEAILAVKEKEYALAQTENTQAKKDYDEAKRALEEEQARQAQDIFKATPEEEAHAANVNSAPEKAQNKLTGRQRERELLLKAQSNGNSFSDEDIQELDAISKKYGKNDKRFKKYVEKIVEGSSLSTDEMNDAIRLSNEHVKSQEDSLNEAIERQKNLNLKQERIDKLQKEVDRLAAEEESSGQRVSETSQEYDKARREVNENGQDEEGNSERGLDAIKISQYITEITQVISSLGLAISSVVSIGNIITNDDLTAWEKFSQITSNLVISLPMLINSFSSLRALMNSAATGLKVATSTAEASEMGFFTLAGAELTAATGAETVRGALLKLLGPAALVIAAIAGIAWVVNTAIKEYNAQANAAKAAAESAENLAEANENLTSTYEDLQSTIETYESAKDQLDECTKGTEEWQEALESANDAAVDLLNVVSDLEGIDLAGLVNEFGELYNRSTGEFNQDIIDAIEEQYSQLVNKSDLSLAYADYNEDTLTARSDLLNSIRSNTNRSYDEGYGETGPSSEEIQNLIISNIDELAGLSNTELQAKIEELGFGDQVKDIEALSDAIDDYSVAVNNATITLEAMSDVSLAEALGDDYDNYSENFINALSNTLTAQTDRQADKLVNDWKSQMASYSGGSNSAYQLIVSQLKELGYEYEAVTGGKAITGNDENRVFNFKDAEGNLVPLTDEDVAKMIASAEALDLVDQNATALAAAFRNLENNVPEGVASGIEDYISTGTFESMTQEEFQAFIDDLESRIDGDIIGNSEKAQQAIRDYLIEQLGLNEADADDWLTNMFGEDYLQQMADAVGNYNTALKSYLGDMFYTTQDIFKDSIDESELSVSAGKYIADAIQGALIYGSEDTVDTLTDMFSNDSIEDMDGFVKVLEDVDDWSNITASDLLDLLDDAGISIGGAEDNLDDFIDAMKETAEATVETIESLQETYANIHDIIDGLETGDTISAEDYKTLIEETEGAASQYFNYLLDGTYKLTGDAKEFYDLVQAQQIQGFTDQIKDLESQLSIQGFASSLDYNTISSTVEATRTGSAFNGYTAEFDTEAAENQLVALQAIGYDEEQLVAWQDILNNGTFKEVKTALTEMSEALISSKEDFENLDNAMQETATDISLARLAIAESAEDYDQLCQYLEDGIIEVEHFNTVYNEMWEAERKQDLDSDAIEDYADYLQKAAKASEDLFDELDDDTAEDLAIQIMNMNDAVDDLADNWNDWSDVLKNNEGILSNEYYEAITGVKDAMSKLLDIDNEFINDDLILDHMTDISAAATGDADAIDRLRVAAYESILIQLDIDDTAIYGGAQYTLAQIQEYFDSLDLNLGVEIGSLEGSDAYIQSLQTIIDSTKMTSDQVQALLTSMGYDVEFEPSELTTVSQYPVTTTHHHREYIGDPDENGNYTDWTDWETTDVQYVPAENLTERTGIKISTADGQEAGGQISVAPTETTKLASTNLSSITKHSSGSYNNYSSSNAGGKSPGSSSGSSDDPDKEDNLEDEIDLYHDINLELQAISTNLSRLQKQESKLTGQALLDNLNDQLATLNDQIDATNVKISIAQGEAADLRSQLSAQGVTFDTAGYITNYAAIMESQLAYVNSCIDAYNAMSAAEQDAYKDTLDAIKKNYEDFVDAISDYDTLISETIPGLEDDIQDAIDEQIEIQITKFTMEVEIRLDMEEAEKDWNEFYRKVILGLDDDDILGNATQDLADILSYFNTTASDITDLSSSNLSDWMNQISEAITNGGTGSIQALTDQVNKTLDQLAQIDESGWADVYGDNQAQALEDLQTYYEELMEQLEDVQDLIDDIEESYLDMIDEAIEAFDEQVDQYEYINDLLNHDVELISLLYGDDAYAEMANYYAQIEANNNQELDFLKQRVAYAYEMMQAETDDEAREAWQQEWEDALEELNDKVEDSIENIIDKYTNTINQIIDELNDAVTNGLGLDYVSEEWDLINDAADIYLDKINAMYGIEEVQQKYLDAINDTDSISAQQKLNDLMEEQLSYLQEKENLTEYDVERAEKLLEIELAQIALEEAQQNKSSMRLRRDSQGNYTYEYVADDNSIADAQQELLALQNELYNFDKEEYQNNLDEMYSVYEEYQSKLLELYEDQTLSAEEREEKIALYAEYYGEIINALVEENAVIRENLMDSAFTELAMLYEVDVENFKNMSAEEQDELMNSLIPQWDSGVQHMADTFAGEGGLIPTCQEALDALNEATNDYQNSLDELEVAAGIDLSSITSGYDEATYAAQDLLAENAELIAQYAEEITAIQNVISQLQELIAQYQAAQAAAEAATAAAYAYWQATQGANANAAANDSGSGTSSYSSSTTGTGTTSSTSSSSSSGSTQGNGSVEVGDTATFTGGTYYYDSYGTSPKGSRGAGGTVTITSVKTDGRPYPIHVTSTDSAYGWLKKSQLSGYDTGGYTGDWDGSDGALALLHQKELVLNSSDTENILNAVSMVRDVSSLLANLDTSAFDKIFSYVNGLNGFSVYEKANDTLEQDVHIEANFPNVTNSTEIEDAFNNLVNVASQYAYRNAR